MTTTKSKIKLLTGFWELGLTGVRDGDKFVEYITITDATSAWHYLIGCLIEDDKVIICYYDIKKETWVWYYFLIEYAQKYFTCIKYVDIRNEYMFPDGSSLKTIYESFMNSNEHFNSNNFKITNIIF